LKKRMFAAILAACLVIPAYSAVVKKSKSDIVFKGFGSFSSIQNEVLIPVRHRVESRNDFKGKGFLGKLAGKTVLRSGEFVEITDLTAMQVLRLDPKKREYTVSPIKKFTEEQEEASEGKPEKTEESDIKIIRNEFKVEDLGEGEAVNGFPTRKYAISWLVEWENVKTGAKGTNHLMTDIWSTPVTDTIAKSRDVESAFSKQYMKAIGLDVDKMQQDMLGTSWMSVMDSLSAAKGRPSASSGLAAAAGEMKKIKGYPVLIDGKYFAKSSAAKGEKAEEESKGGKSLFGGLAKKVLKKKPAENAVDEPALAYRIEVLELKLAEPASSDFEAPADYKKKG